LIEYHPKHKLQLKDMSVFTMIIHGGAGTIQKDDMTPELEKAYLDALQEALDGGYAVLQEDGSPVNAVKVLL
jgi:beta-aspartyl-peptidase (threonine type)